MGEKKVARKRGGGGGGGYCGTRDKVKGGKNNMYICQMKLSSRVFVSPSLRNSLFFPLYLMALIRCLTGETYCQEGIVELERKMVQI